MALEEAHKRDLLSRSRSATTAARFFVRAWRIFLYSFIATTSRGFRKCKLRNIEGAGSWPGLSCTARPAAPTPRRCGTGWSSDGCDFMEYDVENDPAVRPRMRKRTGGQRNVPLLPEDGKVLQVGWQGRSCIVDAEKMRGTISFEFEMSYRASGSVRLSREKLRCVKRLNQNGGDDGTRTRGLCRDRAAF